MAEESKEDFILRHMRGVWSPLDNRWLLKDRDERVLVSAESKTDLITRSRGFK